MQINYINTWVEISSTEWAQRKLATRISHYKTPSADGTFRFARRTSQPFANLKALIADTKTPHIILRDRTRISPTTLKSGNLTL